MCIPKLSNSFLNAVGATTTTILSAIAHVSTIVWFLLGSIIQKIRMVTAPIFNPLGTPQNGFVGAKPFDRHVRILFVNGVGNTLEMCRETASAISRIFNDSLVHYTYLPLRYDQVFRAITYGHRPGSCDLLLTNIRSLLNELSSSNRTNQRVDAVARPILENASKLLIFVHSGGGAMLEAIRPELTAEELSSISVYSFGSAHMFSQNEGFADVKNAVAGGDPVPHMCRLVDRRIFPLGDAWNVGAPALFNIANHPILNEIYQLAMWHIREIFLPLPPRI